MTEDFLHYIWKYKLIAPGSLNISNGSIAILDPGSHNSDAGPDFFNARVKIGNTLWAGNVEIHLRSSDWFRHGHDRDAAYDSVILHVVFQHDQAVHRRNGEEVPTLELAGKIDGNLYAVYQQIMMNRNWIPCAHLISKAGRLVVHNWLDRMLVERFDRKALDIMRVLLSCNQDWNEAFYRLLARNFGFKTNAVPFEMLAQSITLKILNRHKDNLLQIEALLFGQAGMLNLPSRSKYHIQLKKEYKFLASKYGLKPMNFQLWKFLRMRPSNFPTLRIAQFGALIHSSAFLLSRVLETNSLRELDQLFRVKASEYWTGHYSFNKRSPGLVKQLGDHAIHLIVINTVAPFLYVFGKMKEKPELMERALGFLDQLPGESNSIVNGWRALGVPARSACTTQALIHLKSLYCNRKRCLSCAIGNSILKDASHHQSA